jgi:hypothetical protein
LNEIREESTSLAAVKGKQYRVALWELLPEHWSWAPLPLPRSMDIEGLSTTLFRGGVYGVCGHCSYVRSETLTLFDLHCLTYTDTHITRKMLVDESEYILILDLS